MVNYTQSPLVASLRGITPQPPADVRRALCAQLITGLDQYYVHLPQKRAAFAIDPVQSLRLLQSSDGSGFLRALLRTIAGLHDRHTTLKLAEPVPNVGRYQVAHPDVGERQREYVQPKADLILPPRGLLKPSARATSIGGEPRLVVSRDG